MTLTFETNLLLMRKGYLDHFGDCYIPEVPVVLLCVPVMEVTPFNPLSSSEKKRIKTWRHPTSYDALNNDGQVR